MGDIILITGPESTGKTRLANDLAKSLNAKYLSEYARTYLEEQGRDYNFEDIELIAKVHKEKFTAAADAPRLVLDSYLLNLKIWARIKFNKSSAFIDEAIMEFKPAAVLLLKPDIPWQHDPLREDPNNREVLFSVFQNELDELGWPYKIVSGIDEARFQNAMHALKEMIAVNN